MSGVNKVILIGNLGGKPELRYTSSGIPVCTFSIACNERWGKDDSGQAKEHTEWVRCVAWRKLAEICNQYLDKGKQVYIEGKLRSSSYTTAEGEKRYKTEVHVDEMTMLGGRGGGGGEHGQGAGGGTEYDQFEDYSGGGGGFGSDRGGGAFRKEAKDAPSASAFPGNAGNGNGKSAGRTAQAVEAPEVINLENLSGDDFF